MFTAVLCADVDARIFGARPPSNSRHEAVEAHIPYIARKLEESVPLHAMTRHMLGLFNAQPGGRAWRRTLSERGVRAGAGVEVVRDALDAVSRAPARAA